MASYLRPAELNDALSALEPGKLTIVAGGTDFYPARVGKPLDDDVLDVSAISGLKRIEDHPDHVRIGALATWTDLVRADLPPWFRALRLAAGEVGGLQVQNAGTIVGNLCNASPAADSVPCLLAMEATVELASTRGARRLPVAEFILGNRRTARRPDEMVVAVTVPKPARPARSAFQKLGARKYLVISIVMVAALVETEPDGSVAAARMAVGACSEVATRLPALEAALVGRRADMHLAEVPTIDHLSPLDPIGDVRGTAAYRRDAALTLVRRALGDLGSGS